jgi:hypothetical protein
MSERKIYNPDHVSHFVMGMEMDELAALGKEVSTLQENLTESKSHSTTSASAVNERQMMNSARAWNERFGVPQTRPVTVFVGSTHQA